MSETKGMSNYWINQNKTLNDRAVGEVWLMNGEIRCDECCNKDRETDCSHYHRDNCPYCLGTGIPKVN